MDALSWGLVGLPIGILAGSLLVARFYGNQICRHVERRHTAAREREGWDFSGVWGGDGTLSGMEASTFDGHTLACAKGNYLVIARKLVVPYADNILPLLHRHPDQLTDGNRRILRERLTFALATMGEDERHRFMDMIGQTWRQRVNEAIQPEPEGAPEEPAVQPVAPPTTDFHGLDNGSSLGRQIEAAVTDRVGIELVSPVIHVERDVVRHGWTVTLRFRTPVGPAGDLVAGEVSAWLTAEALVRAGSDGSAARWVAEQLAALVEDWRNGPMSVAPATSLITAAEAIRRFEEAARGFSMPDTALLQELQPRAPAAVPAPPTPPVTSGPRRRQIILDKESD